MKGKLDLWRALGVTAGVVIVVNLVNMVVYVGPQYPLPLNTADLLVFALSLVVLVVFSALYFKGGSVRPTLFNGLLLGAVMFVYTFVNGFILGYTQAALAAMMGLPGGPSIMGSTLGWFAWVSALSGVMVPALVGWFMSNKRN